MTDFLGLHIPGTKRPAPSEEVGVSGTAVFGGYVENNEKNPALGPGTRYKTAADILTNVSVIAASVRYFLNLLANPKWDVVPADESPEAVELAKFVEDVINDMASSWTRIVRRSGMYKFHGFSIQEWTTKKREDGRIGFIDIESRPQHTIERWERDANGRVVGCFQRDPQNGEELALDRWKFLYLVDDTLTDSPEGMGWFRHLVEPAERLAVYLGLEKIGFERDLAGIPVGRAPLTAINKAVKSGALDKAVAKTMVAGLENFVKMEIKKKNTGLVLDSQPFESQTADGSQASGMAQWGIELLTGSAGSIAQLGVAIDRINLEMARIIGTENIFVGSNGVGSNALSKDKSTNLYLNVNSSLVEMAEQFSKDLIAPLFDLNGFDKSKMPKFKPQDVAFKDVEQMAVVLRDMASAGAIMAPDDPAINDLRDMLGISRVDFDATSSLMADLDKEIANGQDNADVDGANGSDNS